MRLINLRGCDNVSVLIVIQWAEGVGQRVRRRWGASINHIAGGAASRPPTSSAWFRPLPKCSARHVRCRPHTKALAKFCDPCKLESTPGPCSCSGCLSFEGIALRETPYSNVQSPGGAKTPLSPQEVLYSAVQRYCKEPLSCPTAPLCRSQEPLSPLEVL